MGWQVAVGVFLLLHGLIHPAIFGPPVTDRSAWDTHRSWLLAGLATAQRRRIAVALSVAVAAGYLLAGVALLADAGWWQAAAIVASVLSLALLFAYFHPWLGVGVLVDLAVIVVAVSGWPD